MNKIIKFLTSEEIIVAILALVLLSFSYGPLVYQYLFPPAGKVFTGSFGFPLDFLGNLFIYQEGRIGQWAVTVPMSSTLPNPESFFKMIYTLIGQLSRLFPIDGVIFFHLFRFLFSCGFLLAGYLLISKIFKNKAQRIGAFALAFFSTSISLGQNRLTDYLWTPLSVFQRSAYYYHYLAAFILVLIILILLASYLEKPNKKTFVSALLLGMLATLIHPATILSLILTLPFYLLFLFLREKKIDLKKYISLGVFSLISLSPMIYIFKISQTYPYNTLSATDKIYDIGKLVSPAQFVSGIGPTLILAIIGAYLVGKGKKTLPELLAPWSIVYILGFFILSKFLGYNSGRFLQTPFFVILGILSVYPLWKLSKGKKYIFYALILITLSSSFFSFKQSLRHNTDNFKERYPWINQNPEFMQALNWFDRNTNPEEIVLGEELDSMFVLAYAGNLTYINTQSGQVPNYPDLRSNMRNLLSQTFNEKPAKDFTKENKISFIFTRRPLSYPFLKPVFQNKEVIIYSAK